MYVQVPRQSSIARTNQLAELNKYPGKNQPEVAKQRAYREAAALKW